MRYCERVWTSAPQSVSCHLYSERRRCVCAGIKSSVRYYCAPSWPGCDSGAERERGLLLGLHYWLTGPRLSSSSSHRRRRRRPPPPTSCRRGAANHDRTRPRPFRLHSFRTKHNFILHSNFKYAPLSDCVNKEQKLHGWK